MKTVNDMQKGEKKRIKEIDTLRIPMKLLELGCLPDNQVEFIERAPLGDPIYLNINGSYLAIRKEIAEYIKVEKTENL